MSRLLASEPVSLTNTESRVAFETTGNGAWPTWDRFIAINGRRAYHLGNVCGTCGFLFERLEGADGALNVGALSGALNAGISGLDAEAVAALGQFLPAGSYRALLLEVMPRRVQLGSGGDYFSAEQTADWGIDPFWGLPHYPKIAYYRGDTADIDGDRRHGLFEFIVPLVPETLLDAAQVAMYRQRLSEGSKPTALAVSVLDIKAKASMFPHAPYRAHWCLAHYLLDGHHKLAAAADMGRPLSLLAFLSTDKGISDAAEIDRLLKTLANTGTGITV